MAATLRLDPASSVFPADRESLRRAKAALADAAKESLQLSLVIAEEDLGGFDELAERLATEGDSTTISPLVIYCLGAWWGEWLVRHRRARWTLPPRVAMDLSDGDLVPHATVLCITPFGQIASLLRPDGPRRASELAARIAESRRYLWPFPLIASAQQAAEAYRRLLPEPARRAMEIEQMLGDYQSAWDLYRHALSHDPASPPLLALASACAWRLEMWDWVETTSHRLVELAPEHPTTRHNLAVLLSRSRARMAEAVEHLEVAIKIFPGYSRARLTLASCLWDLRRRDEAIAQARWVWEHDPKLRTKAAEFLRSAGVQVD